MPATLTYDRHKPATSLTRGVVDPRLSQATRWGHATGLAGGRGNLDEAIDAVVADSIVHPDDAQLPLQAVQAFYLNDSVARFRAMYGVRRTHGSTDPWLYLDVELSNVTIPWWRTWTASTASGDGKYPSGDMNEEFDPALKRTLVKAWDLLRTVWVITVRFNTDTPFIADVDGLKDHVNADAVTMGDKSFPAETLWFNGARQRSYEVNGDQLILGMLQFRYRADKWLRERLTGPTTAAVVSMFPTATFAGQFPPDAGPP